MRLLYAFAMRAYAFLLSIAAIWNPKAKVWIAGRKNPFTLPTNLKGKSIIWFHCASLGEYEQALPVIFLVKTEKPEKNIVVSFFSPSGYTNFKENTAVSAIFYLPLDLRSSMRQLVSELKPELVVFVKYEIWHTLIATLKKEQIPCYLIAAHFRKNHIYFKKWASWFRKSLQVFDAIFVQDQASKDLLNTIQIESQIAGDTRIDRVLENKNAFTAKPILADFLQGQEALLLGSAWQYEIKLLSAFVKESNFKGKIIIAPHEIDQPNIANFRNTLGISSCLYTCYTNAEQNKQVLFIDCIGILKYAYAYANVAFVGGAFGKGMHNILEPAVFGKAILIGPKHSRFPEAAALIERACCFSITTQLEFNETLHDLLENLAKREDIKQKLAVFIEENKGAASLIYAGIASKITS